MTHAPHRISGQLTMHVGIGFIGIRVRDIGGVSGYRGYRGKISLRYDKRFVEH